MTTSTFGTQTELPAGLPMRPRGPGRAAAAEEKLVVAEPELLETAPEAPAVDHVSEEEPGAATVGTETPEPLPASEEEPAAAAVGAPETLPVEDTEAASDQAQIPGRDAAAAAHAAAGVAAADLQLSPKSAELLHALLVLSATDLSRGYPWRVHNMSARDWYEGFLFEDAASWLLGIGDAFSMRAFRTAMSGAEALAAFNSLSVLCLTPGVREETNAAVQILLADLPRITRIMDASQI